MSPSEQPGSRASTSFSHLGPCLACSPALHHPSRAVRHALLGGHAAGTLMVVCNPTLWPIHIFRPRRGPGPVPGIDAQGRHDHELAWPRHRHRDRRPPPHLLAVRSGSVELAGALLRMTARSLVHRYPYLSIAVSILRPCLAEAGRARTLLVRTPRALTRARLTRPFPHTYTLAPAVVVVARAGTSAARRPATRP